MLLDLEPVRPLKQRLCLQFPEIRFNRLNRTQYVCTHLSVPPFLLMHVLVTGGLGYIGAHMVAELVETRSPNAPMTVVIVDNLKNSTPRTFETLRHLVPSSSDD